MVVFCLVGWLVGVLFFLLSFWKVGGGGGGLTNILILDIWEQDRQNILKNFYQPLCVGRGLGKGGRVGGGGMPLP